MERRLVIMNKKWLLAGGLILATAIIVIVGVIGEKPYRKIKEGTCVINDCNGNAIAEIHYDDGLTVKCDEKYSTYVDIVLDEATQLVKDSCDIDEESARKKIVADNMIINTYCQSGYQENILEAVKNYETQLQGNCAVVLNDINGRILGAVSQSAGEYNTNADNYTKKPTYAGSVIKPLSDYGPAVEKGIIKWSDKFTDEPYMEVTDENGKKRMWPQNVSPYTYSDVFVADGIARSLNTIAIKTLNAEGVGYAADYLADKFGINVEYEKKQIEKGQPDKALSGIGLGYLNAGVTVKDMAGYYQVFANGGIYIESHSINSIEDSGVELYCDNKSDKEKRVFSEQTAYILNRMMQGVVSENGTADKVSVEGVDVVGKTGTTDNYENNWFVGVTPQYVCAVWNGQDNGIVNADEKIIQYIYNDIVSNLNQAGLDYKVPDGIKKIELCEKTGLAATNACESTRYGYFKSDDEVKECDE